MMALTETVEEEIKGDNDAIMVRTYSIKTANKNGQQEENKDEQTRIADGTAILAQDIAELALNGEEDAKVQTEPAPERHPLLDS